MLNQLYHYRKKKSVLKEPIHSIIKIFWNVSWLLNMVHNTKIISFQA